MPVAKRKSTQTKTIAKKVPPARFLGYKTYNFGKEDHDPILDQLVTIINDGDLTWDEIKNKSGVSPTTLFNYRFRITKRPRFATIAAVLSVFGYDLVPTKRDGVMKAIRKVSDRR